MTIRRLIVRNDPEQPTTALLSVQTCQPDLAEPGRLLDAVREAVGDWMRFSDEGHAVWQETRGGFNVGDLQLCTRSPELQHHLRVRNIESLQIEVLDHPGDRNWDFDTSLVPYDWKPRRSCMKDNPKSDV